jgi:hypothetical protein
MAPSRLLESDISISLSMTWWASLPAMLSSRNPRQTRQRFCNYWRRPGGDSGGGPVETPLASPAGSAVGRHDPPPPRQLRPPCDSGVQGVCANGLFECDGRHASRVVSRRPPLNNGPIAPDRTQPPPRRAAPAAGVRRGSGSRPPGFVWTSPTRQQSSLGFGPRRDRRTARGEPFPCW